MGRTPTWLMYSAGLAARGMKATGACFPAAHISGSVRPPVKAGLVAEARHDLYSSAHEARLLDLVC